MTEFLWQLLRACEKRRGAEDAGQYEFWSVRVNYLVTMCRQNGATEHMIEYAMKGDWVALTRTAGEAPQ